jgi:hypothetical protein
MPKIKSTEVIKNDIECTFLSFLNQVLDRLFWREHFGGEI